MQIVFSDPMTVGLDSAPIEPGWIVEGTPQAHSRELARSVDGPNVVVAWACTAGRFHGITASTRWCTSSPAKSLSPTRLAWSVGSGRATWRSFPPAATACGGCRSRCASSRFVGTPYPSRSERPSGPGGHGRATKAAGRISLPRNANTVWQVQRGISHLHHAHGRRRLACHIFACLAA
jgi:hypothetical protein